MPASTHRTIDTVRAEVKNSLPKGTKVHAMLAAELALDTPTSPHAIWNAAVPSRDDITAHLPLAWPDTGLHAYLPKPALALLRKQQTKLARDYAATQQTALRTIPRPHYLYTWLLVNTRTFYHAPAHSAATLPRDDHMVLQPVADLFNHADAGSAAAGFAAAGFSITASRAHAAGDEVYICYGRHGNDFLLVEYGFVLGDNQWDEVGLDDAVLPELSRAQKEVLDEEGFLGKYVLDRRTVCYRTQLAVRLLCVPVEEWRRFVVEGEDGGEEVQQEVDELLVGILEKYRGTVEGTIQEIEGLDIGQPCQREVLALRWRQIRGLIDQTVERLKS